MNNLASSYFCDYGTTNFDLSNEDKVLKTEYFQNWGVSFNKIGIHFEDNISKAPSISFQMLLHDACHWIVEGHKPITIYCHDAYANDLLSLSSFYKSIPKNEADQKEKDALIYETFYIREKFKFPEKDIKDYLSKKFPTKKNLVDQIWNKSKNVDHSVIAKIEKILSAWAKNISIQFLDEKEFVLQ